MRLTLRYKKEISWLLKDKYAILDANLQNSILNVIQIEAKNLDLKSRIQRTNDKSLLSSQIIEIRRDVNRILNGEPIDYIIGFKEFLNCKIDLSLKPLIPRPETEFWVEKSIEEIKSKTLSANCPILDLCCGSGCIGIALLKNVPNSSVTFVDISDAALKQVEININNNINKPINPADAGRQYTNKSTEVSHPERSEGSIPINNLIELLKSDLFSNLKGKKFDYIFTNPPYVKPKDIKDSLLFEPELALNGYGEDGLNIIYKILEEFPKFLNPNGKLFLEFGYGQKLKIEKKLKELGIIKYDFKKDQYYKYRLLIVII